MRIFDSIRLLDLDRRAWQLWALAMVMILILAAGMALLMYSLVVREGITMAGRTTLRIIFGFCLLAVLFVGYLIDRQVVIARLRKELSEEKKRNIELRAQGNKELLATLFGPGQFCGRLALELQRAAKSKLPLAGLTIALEVAPGLADDNDAIYSSFGDAVKSMLHRLRGEDSIYRFTSGVFGILLPGTAPDVARRVATRIADGLSEAMGISKRYSFDIRITSFPDEAKSAAEMEQMMNVPRQP
jgi:GGDEF domain-containing protein